VKGNQFRDMNPGEVLVVNKLTGLNRMRHPPDVGDIYIFKLFHLIEPFSASSVYLYDVKRNEDLCFGLSIAKNLETLQNYRNKKLNELLNGN
jgi:hypothetical protein